jgi:cell division transport system permease protein
MTNLFRIIRFAFRDFYRNFWLSFNTISIILLSILSVNFLIVVNVIVGEAVQSVENRVNVSIYFNEKASLEQVENLKTRLTKDIRLRSADVISPTDALERFQDRYQNDPEIIAALDELSENPFSYSLVIQANQLEDYTNVTAILEDPVYTQLIEQRDLSDLDSHERAIARVNDISRRAEQIGLAITFILIFNSIVVVINAIRLNIYSHREEIGIMKLVGAKNWMVRGPFVVESILYAFFGTILAAAVIYPMFQFIDPSIPNLLGQPFSVIEYYKANWTSLLLWQVVGIFALNIFSSSLAMRRYLHS